MATSKKKSPEAVRAELLDFAGYEDDTSADMQETLRDSVVEHINALGEDDDTYEGLSKEAQAWWESVVAAAENEENAPLLPASPVAEEASSSEPEEEAPPPAKKTAGKAPAGKTAAKTPAAAKSAGKTAGKTAAKSAAKKEASGPSSAEIITIAVCKKPTITLDQLRAELEKKGAECGDAQLNAVASFTRRVYAKLEEMGKIAP